jgi:transposase
MCSLYLLDTYKREYIELIGYKGGGSREGVLSICCVLPGMGGMKMAGKFTVEQKAAIVIESFTATNIAELCRRHGVSVAQFHRWKDRFMEAGKRGLSESPKGNEYQKEIDDLKQLVGDQALAIAAFKKSQQVRKR